MHGLGAADGVLRKAQEALEKNPGMSASEVRVNVGRFAFSDLSEFESAWKLIARDTPLGKAKLSVESLDGRGCSLSGVLFD